MTTFLRLLDVAVDQKSSVLLSAVRAVADTANGSDIAFERDAAALSSVPGSPFSYWVTDALSNLFKTCTALESPVDGRLARRGVGTNDDFRFLRLWTEVGSSRWTLLAKGGSYSPHYADLFLVLNWCRGGKELKAFFIGNGESPSRNIRSESEYLRPGLTWPLRTQRGLGVRVMPPGCIFGSKGPAAFVAHDNAAHLLSLLAIMTSSAFRYLVELQMAFGSYEVGVIQRTPVPRLGSSDIGSLSTIARRAWSLKRCLDAGNETSHAFRLPAAICKIDRSAVEQELANVQEQIDDEVFRLYGIGTADRMAIQSPSIAGATDAVAINEGSDLKDESDDEDSDLAFGPDYACSWLVGAAFGRFDTRLATGERAVPPDPEPFDPLPARSPGMYPEGEEPADRPDILVDDEGHEGDLAARAIAVAERVKVDVPEELRAWLAKDFFPLHIKMYSKSRRKAPIYWQLSTPSARYSVWLYIHAFTKDTLFRVQNDYMGGERGKLAHEERRLESLAREIRDGATAAKRKELTAQEALVEELRAFLDEVKRVAPLWEPNLDDGVVINFAPLWRLVPQHKAWQKELKSTWDALSEGKYDWAHLAMHLWPERVVPKCAKDRSLAIAHDLEEVFWIEGNDGKWTARKTPTTSVDALVKERTSPAVKSALKGLLEAPVASGKSAGRKGGRSRKAERGGA